MAASQISLAPLLYRSCRVYGRKLSLDLGAISHVKSAGYYLVKESNGSAGRVFFEPTFCGSFQPGQEIGVHEGMAGGLPGGRRPADSGASIYHQGKASCDYTVFGRSYTKALVFVQPRFLELHRLWRQNGLNDRFTKTHATLERRWIARAADCIHTDEKCRGCYCHVLMSTPH